MTEFKYLRHLYLLFYFGTSDEDVKLSLKHVVSVKSQSPGYKSKSKQKNATKRSWRPPTLLTGANAQKELSLRLPRTNYRSQEGAHDRKTDHSCLAPHKNRGTKLHPGEYG